MTIFGTRPEIIRLSLISKVLDQHCDHLTVHTGQNYDESLSDVFFRDLEIRTPDIHLGIKSKSFGGQIGQILTKTDELLDAHKPDRVLILGDTNSGLAAIPAARRQLPQLESAVAQAARRALRTPGDRGAGLGGRCGSP